LPISNGLVFPARLSFYKSSFDLRSKTGIRRIICIGGPTRKHALSQCLAEWTALFLRPMLA
jgi:hypothetical protein